MAINQSFDPSQITDPRLQEALAALQQQAQSVGQSSDQDVHPLTDKIAQLTMALHSAPNSSNLTAVQPQAAGHGLGSLISKLFTGQPMMHDVGSPVIGTNNIPDQSQLPPGMQLPSIGTNAQGQSVYGMDMLQKQMGYEGQLAAQMAKMNGNRPIPPPSVSQKLAVGDIPGALQASIDAGVPFQPQWMQLGATVKGAVAKQAGADAQSSRAATYDNKFWEDAGKALAGLSGNVTYTQQANKVSSGFHLAQLLDSGYNNKTGQFDLSPSQYGEVVLNGAAMLTGTSNFTNEQMETIRQMTAEGKIGAALTYLTGKPFNGNSQAVIKQVAQLAVRQGVVAQDLRDQMIQGQNGALAQAKATNATAYRRTVENALGKAPDLRSKLNSSPWVQALGGLPSNTVTNDPDQTSTHITTAADYLAKFNKKSN